MLIDKVIANKGEKLISNILQLCEEETEINKEQSNFFEALGEIISNFSETEEITKLTSLIEEGHTKFNLDI